MTATELNQLRDLAQSATPGPWRVEARGHASQEVARVNNLEVAPPDSVELAHCATDAAYIAAVSPDVVLGLIDEVLTSRRRIGALTTLTDAQTARLQSYMNDGAKRAEAINTLASEREANAILTSEVERLREFERSAALTLPGVYYMDPLKQLQRMSIDAARYRLLRRKFAIISDGKGNAEFCPINLPRPTYIAPNTAIELDTALDRERLGMDGAERPPTPVGWSDTDWIKYLQEQDEQPHPLAGQHINQGSMDAAADEQKGQA